MTTKIKVKKTIRVKKLCTDGDTETELQCSGVKRKHE